MFLPICSYFLIAYDQMRYYEAVDTMAEYSFAKVVDDIKREGACAVDRT